MLYARFANDNGLDMVEAQRLLMGQEYRTWRMDIEDYVKEIQANGDNELLRELNTLAMRSRITRLDKLYADTLVEIGKLSKDVRAAMDKFLPSAYKDFYYHDLYDIGQKRGLIHPVSRVDAGALENVIRTPWSGKNYSARIWKNGEKLAETIQRTVTAGMHRGCSADELARYVKQRMNVGYSQAIRLVRTELNYVENRAIVDGIKESGMKYYRFVATLDRRTSATCRDHDGHIYPVDDYNPGTNAPPLHPHCRSTIVGSIKGDGKPKGTRAARDESGKYIRVPADMSYHDWKAVYVDKSKPFGTWAKENGFTEPAAKYAPSATSQGGPGSGIIEPKEDPLKPKELAGVKRGEEMSFDDANQGRGNSKYRIEQGCDINCQSCVVAHEARLRGYNVTAKANFKNPTAERVARQTNLAWINPETQAPIDYITDRKQLYNPKKFMDFMHNTLKEGERYTLEFGWKGRSNVGHIISLYIEKGKIVFYDPQSGRLYKEGTRVNTGGKGKDIILQYLSRLKWQRTFYGHKFYTTPKIMRVDNAVIEPNIAKDILREYEE